MFPTMDLSQALAPGEGEAYWLIGTLVTIKVAGELTGNALSVTEHLVPVGGGCRRTYTTSKTRFSTSSKGRSRGIVGGSRCGPGTGDTVFLPRGVAHAWRAEGDCPARLVIVTTPAGFRAVLHGGR